MEPDGLLTVSEIREGVIVRRRKLRGKALVHGGGGFEFLLDRVDDVRVREEAAPVEGGCVV